MADFFHTYFITANYTTLKPDVINSLLVKSTELFVQVKWSILFNKYLYSASYDTRTGISGYIVKNIYIHIYMTYSRNMVINIQRKQTYITNIYINIILWL